MKERITRVLKIFDIYSQKYTMKIDGQQRFKTLSGGIISLVSIILLVLIFVKFGANFYLRINPNINTLISNFQNEFDSFQYSNIFNRVVISIQPNMTLDYEFKVNEKLFIDCNMKEIKTIKNYSYGKRYLCSDFQFKDTINIRKKQNTAGGSMNFLDNMLKLDDFTLFLTSIFPYKDDYESFFHEQVEIISDAKIRLGYTNMYNIYFNKYFLKDDKGWLYESYEEKLYYGLNSISFQGSYSSTQSSVSIKLVLLNETYFYYRTYEKLQDLLARIGGLMKVISFIAMNLNYLLTVYSIDMMFILSSFKFYESFELEEKQNRKLKGKVNETNHNQNNKEQRQNHRHESKQSKDSKMKIVNNSPIPVREQSSNLSKTQNEKLSRTDKQEKANKLWFPLYLKSYLNIITGKKVNFKEEVIDEDLFKFQTAAEICEYTRSINYLDEKLFELEFIKTKLFNENQILALSIAEKPYLTRNNNYCSETIMKVYRNFLKTRREKEEEVVNYFSDKLRASQFDTSELSKTDLDIINLMSKEVKERISRKYDDFNLNEKDENSSIIID